MKKNIFIALFTGISLIAAAQQLPLYNQYTSLPYLYNPSMVGYQGGINANLLHRSQWKGIPGAPVTSVLTAEGPVQEKNIGLGVTMFSDVTDIVQRTGFYTSYSYKLKIDEDNKFLFGLSLGVLNNRIDFTKSIVSDQNDPLLMSRQNQHKTIFDATLGTTYVWKTLEVGIAVPQLLGTKVSFVSTNSSSYYYMSRHFIFSAKYTFDVDKEKGMKVYPLVLVRYAKNAPVQYDINAVFDWEKFGWAAISYRSNYALGLNLGVRLNKTLKAGYAFDWTINTVKNYAGGAHELLLGYTFGAKEEKAPNTEMASMADNNKVDSLYSALKTNNDAQQAEINRLNSEVDRLRKEDSLRNAKTVAVSGNNILNADVNAYKAENGGNIPSGFYVVVGAFKNIANAEKVKSSVTSKYGETDLFFNKEKQLHYVYVIRGESQETAEEILTIIKTQFPGSWIFNMQ
ncbi:MAG: PorP/SprF family type IX secretion system membrane protein [Bacteroidia bacterium]